MNIIFLDFDGPLVTDHLYSDKEIEERIKVLSIICKETNSKVVISSSVKMTINEETMTSEIDWVQLVLDNFKKYEVDCIGITPNVEKWRSSCSFSEGWKEDEIIKYLETHEGIEHFCILDDDDTKDYMNVSNLEKVRNHLVKVVFSNRENPKEEGLLLKHKDEIIEKLSLNNEYKYLRKRSL